MAATAASQNTDIPAISDIDVPLRATRTPLSLPRSRQKVHDHIVRRLRENSSRLALIGPAGMGKTTLLRELVLRLENTAHILMPYTPYSSFDDFIEALKYSLGSAGDRDETLTVEYLCRNLAAAGTPLVLLIDNALAWPPFLLIELAVLSQSADLHIVFADRPGLLPHTETLGVPSQDVLELTPFTRAEMDQFASHWLVNPATDAPRQLKPGTADRIWYYTGGMPHLASLLCDRLAPAGPGDADRPVTADDVDFVAGDIGLTEREYLENISSPPGDPAIGEAAPRRIALAGLNKISLIAAGASALAVLGIVASLHISQPLIFTPGAMVWGGQPEGRLADGFSSPGSPLDRPLIVRPEPLTAQLAGEPEPPTDLLERGHFLADNFTAMLTANLGRDPLAASPPPPAPARQSEKVGVPMDATVMLERADSLMAAHRYTLPEGNNAFEIYAEILGKDPSNGQAISGLQAIHAAYLSWGKEAVKNQQWDKATRHFKMATQVLPANEESKILLQEAKTRVSWLMTFQKLTESDDTGPIHENAKPDDSEGLDQVN